VIATCLRLKLRKLLNDRRMLLSLCSNRALWPSRRSLKLKQDQIFRSLTIPKMERFTALTTKDATQYHMKTVVSIKCSQKSKKRQGICRIQSTDETALLQMFMV
jgi:hypothetical protein